MKRTQLILSLSLLCLFGCKRIPVVDVAPNKGDTLKENMINANRYIAKSEETQIEAFICRRGWQMNKLSGGARVMELSTGMGRPIEYEDTIVVHYRLEAINGATLYSQATDTLIAGHLQPVRGLDAALLTLHHGSQARVILPSEQAYGVVGDGNRIPTRAILVYHIQVE